jgi:hypothetical protein
MNTSNLKALLNRLAGDAPPDRKGILLEAHKSAEAFFVSLMAGFGDLDAAARYSSRLEEIITETVADAASNWVT